MKASADKTLTLQVEGLCCTECAAAVEKALARRAGVGEVKILSAAEKVEVRYDERAVQAEELAGSIAALGYQVRSAEVLPGPPAGERRAFFGEAIRRCETWSDAKRASRVVPGSLSAGRVFEENLQGPRKGVESSRSEKRRLRVDGGCPGPPKAK